jgi:hypothetical protein
MQSFSMAEADTEDFVIGIGRTIARNRAINPNAFQPKNADKMPRPKEGSFDVETR